MPITLKQVRENLDYYGLSGEDLEACAQAYMERVADGDAPDLGEYAADWAELPS